MALAPLLPCSITKEEVWSVWDWARNRNAGAGKVLTYHLSLNPTWRQSKGREIAIGMLLLDLHGEVIEGSLG